MNEQLDRLKDVFMNNLRSGHSNIITDADFSWLIKQAKRVEELRKINKWLEDGWDTEIKIRQISDERMGKLFEQNQRYKQALERIAEHEVYGIDIRTGECLSTDAGEIAKSALRGDGDE